MKTVHASHLAVVLAVTALLGLGLGAALEDAAPPVIFVSVLALGAISAAVFRALEQR